MEFLKRKSLKALVPSKQNLANELVGHLRSSDGKDPDLLINSCNNVSVAKNNFNYLSAGDRYLINKKKVNKISVKAISKAASIKKKNRKNQREIKNQVVTSAPYNRCDDMVEQMFSSLMPTVTAGVSEDTKKFFQDLLDNVTTTVKGLPEEIKKQINDSKIDLNVKLPNLFETIGFSSIWENLKNYLGTFDDFRKSPIGAFILQLIVDSIVIYHLKSIFRLSTPLATLVVMSINLVIANMYDTTVSAQLNKWFDGGVDLLINYFSDQNEFKEQSFTMFDMEGLAALLLLPLFGSNCMSADCFSDVFRNFLSLGQANDKVSKGLDFLFSFFSKLIRHVAQMFNYDNLKNFGLRFPELNDIAIELNEMIEGFHAGTLDLDGNAANKLRSISMRLRTFIVNIGHGKDDVRYRSEAVRLLSEVERFINQAGMSGTAKGGARIEPISIALIGGSGNGKSTISEVLMHELAPYILHKSVRDQFVDNPATDIFTITAGMGEFCDGYTGQGLVRIDDMLQKKDDSTGTNPLIPMMISMHNTAPYTLNMASLEKKGNVPFVSKAIFVTDNSLKLGPSILKSIVTPSAFVRRFDLTYLVVPKDEFVLLHQDQTLDQVPLEERKIKKHVLDEIYNFDTRNDIWDFYRWDWSEGKRFAGDVLSYKEVRAEFLRTYSHKQRIGTKLLNIIKSASQAGVDAANLHEQVGVQLADPWLRLNLNRSATPQEIKDAYLRLVVQVHPDTSSATDSQQLDTLLDAVTILRDPILKEEWLVIEELKNTNDLDYSTASRFQLKLLDLRKKFFKLGVDEKCSSLKQLLEFITNPDSNFQYKHNVMPSDCYLEVMAERFGTTKLHLQSFFTVNNYEEDTPMGDYLDSWLLYCANVKNKIYASIRSCLSRIKQLIVDVVTNKNFWIGTALLMTGSYALYKVVNGAHPSTIVTDMLVDQSSTKISMYKKMKAMRPKKPIVVQKVENLEEQSRYIHSTSLSNVRGVVENNTFSWSFEGQKEQEGHFLFYQGKKAIGLAHYMSAIERKGASSIVITHINTGESKLIKMSDVEVVMVENDFNEDVCYYHFRTLFKDCTNITKQFVGLDDAKLFSLLRLAHWGSLIKYDYHTKKWETNPVKALPFSGVYGQFEWTASAGLMIPVVTEAGSCGSTWIYSDSVSGRSFIGGIHAAGNGTSGLSLIIDKTAMLSAFPEVKPIPLEVVACTETDKGFVCQDYSSEWVPPQIKIVGNVPFRSVNGRSTLKPTVLFNKWKPATRFPAKLDVFIGPDGNKINPWYNARAPYGTHNVQLDQRVANHLADMLANEMHVGRDFEQPWKPRKLTFEEACAGVPSWVKGLPRSTSSGYPWCDISRKKHAFFGSADEYQFTSPQCELLKLKVEKDIELLESGGDPDWKYLDFLKDECRSKAKVDAGAARMVSGSPLDKSIVTAIYFKDFMRFFQQEKILNGSAIGINPYKDWDNLVAYLVAKGSCFIDGDYKGYDTRMPMVLAKAALRIVYAFYKIGGNYSDKDFEVMDKIIEKTYNSLHVGYAGFNSTLVLAINEAMPSGDLLTATFNTLINKLNNMYAKAIIFSDQGLINWHDLSTFDINLFFKDGFIAQGDDHVLSVCDDHKHFLTQKSYGEAMTRMGYQYTDALKTGILKDGHSTIHEISFLKRTFTHIEGYSKRWFAPLDLDVILEMPYYVHNNAPDDVLSSIIKVVMIELSAHGYEVFAKWSPTISKHCSENGIFSEYLPLLSTTQELKTSWENNLVHYMDMVVDL